MSSDVVLYSSLIIIQHIFCVDCIHYTFFLISGTAQQYFFSNIILLWDHVVDTRWCNCSVVRTALFMSALSDLKNTLARN